jgi:hypothetical protein
MAEDFSKPLSYTANPLLLMFNDLILFLQITFTWPITDGLLSIVLPLSAGSSGSLDELSITPANVWTLFMHFVLIAAQVAFIISLFPLLLVGLPVFYLVYVTGFVNVNKWVSRLLNGPRRKALFQSAPDCVKGKQEHPNERWVFINGVAVG